MVNLSKEEWITANVEKNKFSTDKYIYVKQDGVEKEVSKKQWENNMKNYRSDPRIEQIFSRPSDTVSQKIGKKVKRPIAKVEMPKEMDLINEYKSKQDFLLRDLEKNMITINNYHRQILKIIDDATPIIEETSRDYPQEFVDEWVMIRNAAMDILRNEGLLTESGMVEREIIENGGSRIIERISKKNQPAIVPTPVLPRASPLLWEQFFKKLEDFSTYAITMEEFESFNSEISRIQMDEMDKERMQNVIRDVIQKKYHVPRNVVLDYETLQRDQELTDQAMERRKVVEEEEKQDIPHEAVDSHEVNDPLTKQPTVVSIVNADEKKVDDPNLPMNMQVNPEILIEPGPDAVAVEVLGMESEVSSKGMESPTSTVRTFASTKIPESVGSVVGMDVGSVVGMDVGSVVGTDVGTPGTDVGTTPPETFSTSDNFIKNQLKFEKKYEVKFHKAIVNEFFSSVDNPDWDLQLNRSITGNWDNGYYNKEQLIELMNQMITNKNLKIMTLVTTVDSDPDDVLTEYVIISQIHFCALRNLHKGTRQKTASVSLGSLLGIMGKEKETDPFVEAGTQEKSQNQTTDFQSTPVGPASTATSIPNLIDTTPTTIDKIAEAYSNRRYGANGPIYGKLVETIKQSVREHSEGVNYIYGPEVRTDQKNTLLKLKFHE